MALHCPDALRTMGMHLYHVVGRHLPVTKKDGTVDNKQKIYRMKVFAENVVRATHRVGPDDGYLWIGVQRWLALQHRGRRVLPARLWVDGWEG